MVCVRVSPLAPLVKGPGASWAVKAYFLPPGSVLPGWVRAYVEEPMKPTTVQALPPEVGGVVPDSKPGSRRTAPVQVVVGVEVVRVRRVRSRRVVLVNLGMVVGRTEIRNAR